MASIFAKLLDKKLLNPPSFLKYSIQYECIMGSYSYGISGDLSDTDIYGFCIPPKNMIFPHLSGEILDFGRQKKRFGNYQQHHIKDDKNEYDLDIYNIVKYFDLCMNCNPNMIDSLFVPNRCILHITDIGQMVRDNRKLFLNKKAFHTYRGYSFQQIHKAEIKDPIGKRKELLEKYGFDTKYCTHCCRLLLQVEQILIEHDLDLEKNSDYLKSIRRGEVPLEEIKKWFFEKERSLEKVYTDSTLPYEPREEEIKDLLLKCLEHHYGNLDKCILNTDKLPNMIRELETVIEKYRR